MSSERQGLLGSNDDDTGNITVEHELIDSGGNDADTVDDTAGDDTKIPETKEDISNKPSNVSVKSESKNVELEMTTKSTAKPDGDALTSTGSNVAGNDDIKEDIKQTGTENETEAETAGLLNQNGTVDENAGLQPLQQAYGERLRYDNRRCNDAWAAVLFVLQFGTVLGFAIYFWATNFGENDLRNDATEISSEGFYVTIVGIVLTSSILGLLILTVSKLIGWIMLKVLLSLNIAVWFGMLGFGIYLGETSTPSYDSFSKFVIIFSCIGVVTTIGWTWIVWENLEFAQTLIAIACKIVTKYTSIIGLQFIIIGLNILFTFTWFTCLVGYAAHVKRKLDEPDGKYSRDLYNFIVFLLFVVLYWNVEVFQYLSHTTTCGIAAKWYYTQGGIDPDGNTFVPALLTAFGRSFGSICIGAVLASITRIIRGTFNVLSESMKCCGKCCVYFTTCIDGMSTYFNEYAFAHFAIYGSKYTKACTNTGQLLKRKELRIILKQNLSNSMIFLTGIIGLAFTSIVAWFISSSYYKEHDINWYPEISILSTFVGALMGYIITSQIVSVITSCVSTFWICFAEDPNIFIINHPYQFDRISEIKPEIKDIVNQIQIDDENILH
mmetsp:Transcript_3025/g.3682  ORF Transcript_3025/g.3682 Transcript_3025/m.3682 type:complete len:609 (-) Transcript_3025:27-1853(-)